MPISIRIGRKKLIIFNMVAVAIIGLSKSLVTSYWLYVALEMLEPMLGDPYSSVFTMAIETVTNKHRPLLILAMSISMTMGQILTAVIAYLTSTWRIFIVCIYAPSLLFILYIFWMDESLRWLLVKGSYVKAQIIMKKAIKMNNMTIDESKIIKLGCEDTPSDVSWRATIKITFASKKLISRLFMCVLMWFTTLFNTYSLLINSVSLEGDKYINYGLTGMAASVAGVILFIVLAKFQRKRPLILFLTLIGVFCISQSFLPKGYVWLSTLLYLCGKVSSTVSLRILYLYTTELFPTYTRNTMLALCSSMGRIGAVLAPQTPLLFQYWSSLPALLVGVLSVITASMVTFMPDTSEDILPDNVIQAEAAGGGLKTKQIL